MLRENITVHNLPVDELAPGTTLAIGAVLLQVSGPCDPCYKMDRIRPGLQSELQGQRGVLATVVTSGRIAVGDTISVQAS
jgi:MOSC domain-containing protein YiiM